MTNPLRERTYSRKSFILAHHFRGVRTYLFGPVCLGRTLWWWEHGAEQASPHGGPGCAEKGEKEMASHNILPKTHPFPAAGLRTFKTPTCGKHFQFNYSHPPLLGALSLTFTQPSRGAAPALAITDTTALLLTQTGARLRSPGTQKHEPWWLPPCVIYPKHKRFSLKLVL